MADIKNYTTKRKKRVPLDLTLILLIAEFLEMLMRIRSYPIPTPKAMIPNVKFTVLQKWKMNLTRSNVLKHDCVRGRGMIGKHPASSQRV